MKGLDAGGGIRYLLDSSNCFTGFSLSLATKTEAEAEKLFAALGEGGAVTMPLTKTFFAPKFGMLTDRFGMGWMVMVGDGS